jgi:branched-chain amino acid transport system substrate-binding protein
MQGVQGQRYAGLLTIGALVALTACGGGATSGAGGAKTPITIGYIAPLTGVSAGPGKNEQDGWNLGLKDFGRTVDGHPVVTKFLDSAGDPNTALSDARVLVTNDNISLLEGPLLANEIAAVSSYVDPLGVPTDDLSLCSAEQLTNYRKYGNAISSGWTCDQPDLIAAEYLYNDLHYRHVTTIASDYAFGWESIGAFVTVFEKLGGRIDKEIWAPITTNDYSSYVSQIPPTTQAVFDVTVGANSTKFTTAYAQFGLKNKIPLFGNTTLTDYSVLPSETPAAVLGVKTVAQYCDGIDTPANQKFANEYFAAYGEYPGYYAEAAYAKARLALAALRAVQGNASDRKGLIKALKSTTIVAPRGPVKLNKSTDSPVQNIYVCEVREVNGHLRNVPIKTYANVQPWGPLTPTEWEQHFLRDSAGRPPV